jgi:hypothetical protein
MASQTVKNALATGGPPPHKVTMLPPPPTRAEAILLPTQRCPLAVCRAAADTLPVSPPRCRHCCGHCCAAAAPAAALPPPLHCHHRRHAAVAAAAAALLLPPPPTSSSYSLSSQSLSSSPLPPPLFKLIVDYCLSPTITRHRCHCRHRPSFSSLSPLLSSLPFLLPFPPPLLVDCCLLSFPLPLLSPPESSLPPRWWPCCRRRHCHRNATK